MSWSPKGKQIAVGLESGDIVTYSPSDVSTPKCFIPRPPTADEQTIISTTWLSNTEFHGIYVPRGPLTPDSEQTHYILHLDSKANVVGDIKLNTPYMPFPALRPPGAYSVALRQWEPARTLLFIGDGTSSDIGLIGSLSEPSTSLDSWRSARVVSCIRSTQSHYKYVKSQVSSLMRGECASLVIAPA